MAVGIRPTDALVHRLLQQSQHANANLGSGHKAQITADHQGAVADQVNISPEAKRAAEGKHDKVSSQEQATQSKYGQKDLEARLLSLYSHGIKG